LVQEELHAKLLLSFVFDWVATSCHSLSAPNGVKPANCLIAIDMDSDEWPQATGHQPGI
jgi:hypothetical protein